MLLLLMRTQTKVEALPTWMSCLIICANKHARNRNPTSANLEIRTIPVLNILVQLLAYPVNIVTGTQATWLERR